MTVIYTSNTGFTKKYAEAFAKRSQLNCASLKQVSPSKDAIYFGWCCANMICGLKKAMQNHSIKAICVVGMKPIEQVSIDEVKKQNAIVDIPVFYMQGGVNREKLNWVQKLILKFAISATQKENPTDEQTLKMLDAMKNGGSFFNEDNLTDLFAWSKENM